jgi:hypothetical protein
VWDYGTLLLAGLALRVGVALVSLGSDDIHIWEDFARQVGEGGLLGRYGEMDSHGHPMNHPPFAVGMAALVHRLADWTGLPFAPLFKLPMIAADLSIAALLGALTARTAGGRAARTVVAAYVFSPAAVLISAYHGSTDCLAAALAFAAAALALRGRAAASGFALGAALNVKLIPILLLPVLGLQYRDRRSALRFALAFGCALLPFAPFAAAQPLGFLRATLGYGSEMNPWGLLAILSGAFTIPVLRDAIGRLAQAYFFYGPPLMLSVIGTLAVVGRVAGRWNATELCGACMGLFLVITPGFGVQYLIYVLPFLLLSHLRHGMAYSLLAGLFLVVVYASYWTGSFPFDSHFERGFPMPAPLIGLAAWAVLIDWLRQLATGPSAAIKGSRAC